MALPIKTARTMQLVTLAMLFTSFAQIAYWIADEASYMENVLKDKLELFDHAALAGQVMLDDGHGADEVVGHFPSLVVVDGRAQVSPDYVSELDRLRRRRLIRYGSEGTFLLLVFLGGITTLTHSLRQSRELMLRQENFIAAVSHEFKTPLASLKLSAETLQLREVSRENQRKLAGRMIEDADRLESMVTNILRAGMLAEGRLNLRPEPLRLAELVTPLAQRHACRAHLQQVEVETHIDSELRVECDPTALSTVMDNLISNAIKSVASRGPGSVQVKAALDGPEVRIDVLDDGVGFAAGEARRLFEKFYRPGDELRRRTKGTGLGLYVVKSLVEHSGGRVEARSPGEGRGATFSVWLPRVREVVA